MNTTKWVIDPAHSEIGFRAKHLMISTVKGFFTKFTSEVETTGDDFTTAKIKFFAATDSVNTNSENRDQHLKGADFFDSANFPNMIFVSTGIAKIDDDNYELQGDLTIRDITKPVKLNVEVGGIQQDPWGNTKAGFAVTGKINRKDWDLNWNATLEAGGVLVSDEIRLTCEVQLVKEAVPVA